MAFTLSTGQPDLILYSKPQITHSHIILYSLANYIANILYAMQTVLQQILAEVNLQTIINPYTKYCLHK